MDGVFALRDPVSAGTHFAGFLWAVFGFALLCRMGRGDRAKRLSLACFGLSMMALYAASSTYHALSLPPAELQFYRLLDHSAIYLLIAGTYTPIFAVLLRGRYRDTLLVMMWALAALGIAWKWTLPTAHYPLTIAVYLFMGWLGLLPMLELTRVVGVRAIGLGVAGGLLYTIGALCDLLGWPVIYAGVFGHHELLHILVLAGTACHFVFIVKYVVPFRRCPLAASHAL